MSADRKAPQFVVDAKGMRTAVILDMQSYAQLLEAAEELDDIRAYDEAKARNEEAIPFEPSAQKIEDARK